MRALLCGEQVPIFFLMIGVIFFGAAVYYFEQLEENKSDGTAQFPDVGTGIWFMIVQPARPEPAHSWSRARSLQTRRLTARIPLQVTFTTVGYGDTYPVTHAGRAVTCLAILCGVIFMAMPLNIVSSTISR